MKRMIPFVSAEPIFAQVREEMASYFEAGAIDDAEFPIWTKKCLKKLERSGYPIREVYLPMSDYECALPSDFKWVKEAWVCAEIAYAEYQNPVGYYYQTDCRIEQPKGVCDPCEPFEPPELSCDPCDFKYRVVHKVLGTTVLTFSTSHLLRPGNVHARGCCDSACPNLGSTSIDTFDIRDGKLVTNISDGSIYLSYYADHESDDGEIFIPDEEEVQNYIYEYLIYRCYRKLCTVVTSDTYHQIEAKKREADQKQTEAFINASTYKKKETIEQKQRAHKRILNKFNKYYPRR